MGNNTGSSGSYLRRKLMFILVIPAVLGTKRYRCIGEQSIEPIVQSLYSEPGLCFAKTTGAIDGKCGQHFHAGEEQGSVSDGKEDLL